MKYPGVVFFRLDQYNDVDNIIHSYDKELLCNIKIISNVSSLNHLFNPNFPILVTFGNLNEYLHIVKIPSRFNKRWIHFDNFPDITAFNNYVNNCFMHNVLNISNNIPSLSVFTTCYKSYDKIKRAYHSLKQQTFLDWEWIILDDSPEDEHFTYLTNYFNTESDNRVRLYKRAQNSGNIGNVKNEAVLLCRGKYVLELDHDDELTSYAIEQMYNAFESDKEVGFVYMNYANVYENGTNFNYGDHFSLGYAGYYCEKINGKWLYIASSPNINNVSLSNIIAIPNHPRSWRKDLLISIGNYSELLPISDDYELFLRTVMSKTKIIKINELGYIQYMNDNNNNFSLIRNSEINRLCRDYIYPIYLNKGLNQVTKELNGYENYEYSQIWKRDNYVPIYCNQLIGKEKQIVFIGFQTLLQKKDFIQRKTNTDYIVLDNHIPIESINRMLDYYGLDFFKSYSLNDCTETELVNYFKCILSNDKSNYEIIYRETIDIQPIKTLTIQDNIHEKKQHNLKITIITPSIRPENLLKISKYINFDYVSKWLIIYDSSKIKENPLLFKTNNKVIELLYNETESISGNAQRNHGLDLIENEEEESYIYFLDDDSVLSDDIYKLFDRLESKKVYTFSQQRDASIFPYVNILKGDIPEVYLIDTSQLLISSKLIHKNRWELSKYNADGYFIRKCIQDNKDSWIFVDNILTGYNNI